MFDDDDRHPRPLPSLHGIVTTESLAQNTLARTGSRDSFVLGLQIFPGNPADAVCSGYGAFRAILVSSRKKDLQRWLMQIA